MSVKSTRDIMVYPGECLVVREYMSGKLVDRYPITAEAAQQEVWFDQKQEAWVPSKQSGHRSGIHPLTRRGLLVTPWRLSQNRTQRPASC